MRIFSKKAFRFDMEGQNSMTIHPLEFKDVPEWVKDTYLFELAKKEGSVELIVSREQSLRLENADETPEDKELRERAKELNIRNFQRMGIEKLREKIFEAKQKEKNMQNVERPEEPLGAGELNGDYL